MRTGYVRRCGNVTRRESTRQSQKNCKNKHSRIPCVQNWADNDTHSRQQRWAENDAHQQEHARERDTGNVPGTSRHQSFVAQEENVLRPWTRLKANTVHNSIKYPKTTFELCMKLYTGVCFNIPLSAKHCQIVCIHHEASDLPLCIWHAASVENAGIKKYAMNFKFEFLQSFSLL